MNHGGPLSHLQCIEPAGIGPGRATDRKAEQAMRKTILSGVVAVVLVTGCTGSAVTSTSDASTDHVESIRGVALQATNTLDRSGDQAEALRGAAVLPVGTPDHSYDAVERSRGRVSS